MLVQNSSTRCGNAPFDGPDANEDFGLEQITLNPADRYAFRTSPLRNVKLQPTFFHNGAYTRLEDALRFHLDALSSARKYNRAQAGVDNDLKVGPIDPVLQRIDPLLATPVTLTKFQGVARDMDNSSKSINFFWQAALTFRYKM